MRRDGQNASFFKKTKNQHVYLADALNFQRNYSEMGKVQVKAEWQTVFLSDQSFHNYFL